ncbi:type II toxin-antitoxin system HicB family antitoxin [Asaia platycodi]|uniref:type II toxin-antitoxin system HicB family antitoxin n=1 Tax=Asaia platycodi TaxID=610243 RepID=UPI000B3147D9|nr:type II toxin-antitoxin system HicB family antitoxin [Asaia platycodi]
MTSYIALIHKDPEGDFGVSFPDFPGCTTVGRSLEEARILAQEALEFHIEGMNEDGAALPAPSSLDAIMQNPDFADGVAFPVTVRTPKA